MISPVESYHQPVSQDSDFMLPTPEGPRLPVISSIDEHITKVPGLPGVLCKVCLENDVKNWVVPGLPCSNCGTAAPSTA